MLQPLKSSPFSSLGRKGSPVKDFMEILHLKKADAESIYLILIDWLKTKNVQCHKLVQQIVDVWNRKPRIVAV